jgi:tRNA(Ile)-lysidine synthetase-like protein
MLHYRSRDADPLAGDYTSMPEPPDNLPMRSISADVPPGRWAVGVSGGADSVALLLLLTRLRDLRGDLFLHVVHLDHQTRGAESTADAEFVRDLAVARHIPHTIARLDEIEPAMSDLPANPSARYRALRHEVFRRVINGNDLQGVALAHHADDQAETVLHRLIRGSGLAGLAAMFQTSHVAGLTILRPLLALRREGLRRFLIEQGQTWREDASNASDHYFRNRLRRLLRRHRQLTDDLLALADACASVRDWSHSIAPRLPAEFPIVQLQRLPALLARECARLWLLSQGVPPGALARAPDAIERLIALATDAATASRMQFPGGVMIRRRKGVIAVEPTA